jgi:cystathionine beta-lyase
MAGVVPHVTVMGYVAALAAYRDSRNWHSALLAYLRENRELVTRAVRDMPGFSMGHVEGTYLAWIDARSAGLRDPALFFETVGVGLSDGKEFGGPGFVRLNFGCPRHTLAEALQRMERGMRRLTCE